MKKKELQNLRTQSSEELSKKASALRLDIMKAKMNIKSGKETNTRKARNLRHELAQILTIKGIIDREPKKKEVKTA